MDHRFIPTSRVKTVNPPQTQPLPCKLKALVPPLPSLQAGRHTPFLVDTVPHAKASGCRAQLFAQRVTVAPLDCPSPPSPSVTLPALFGSFWLNLALFGSFWFILVHFGSFWLFLALFGSSCLAHFGSFCFFLALFGSHPHSQIGHKEAPSPSVTLRQVTAICHRLHPETRTGDPQALFCHKECAFQFQNHTTLHPVGIFPNPCFRKNRVPATKVSFKEAISKF